MDMDANEHERLSNIILHLDTNESKGTALLYYVLHFTETVMLRLRIYLV